MAPKGEEPPYSQLPPHTHGNNNNNQHPQQDQYYILLPLYHSRPRNYTRLLIFITSLIFLTISIYLLWPSDPSLTVVRLNLNHVQLHTKPSISLDISMDLTVRVRNRDFFSLDYESLVVSIGYRGRELGFVDSSGGRVRARGSSYVNATLSLNGIEVLHDVFYLLEDLAKGVIPFDTVTVVRGKLGVLFFKVPIKCVSLMGVFVDVSGSAEEEEVLLLEAAIFSGDVVIVCLVMVIGDVKSVGEVVEFSTFDTELLKVEVVAVVASKVRLLLQLVAVVWQKYRVTYMLVRTTKQLPVKTVTLSERYAFVPLLLLDKLWLGVLSCGCEYEEAVESTYDWLIRKLRYA
ncbi:hypothetical protein GIB67_003957 [Kingdonia uniflora]|uniref:Late embryogenesis abundant protein LEA-2 subgroup domain-containing protein n=1 Tax=Kingdonia uniflora TaxID=39325 RepID=A0A7J7NQZ3_9MAGN|nr:hypothetical protein GIB67_003957 [Kingdonia uniflora]